MTDIREVLDEIEKGCEGVTPGPWKAEQTGNEWHVFMLSTDETICVIEEWSREIDGADAAHLARLDPQTMLAIIELARKGLAADAGATELRAELSAAVGYMRNAMIDLETGASKATALRTITGGIKRAEAVLASPTQDPA